MGELGGLVGRAVHRVDHGHQRVVGLGQDAAALLDGNNVDKGRAILDELNHPLVTQVDTMDGAADKAAELAHQA